MLVQGGPGVETSNLCIRIGADFGTMVFHAALMNSHDDLIHKVATRAGAHGKATCFVVENMSAEDCRVTLQSYLRAVGRPLALLLLAADATTLVHRQLEGMRLEQESSQHLDTAARAAEWLNENLPRLEAEARAEHIPVTIVDCEGGMEAQIQNLLLAMQASL